MKKFILTNLLIVSLLLAAMVSRVHAGVMRIYGADGSEAGAQFWSGYYGSVHLGSNRLPVGGQVYSTLNGSYVGSAASPFFTGVYTSASTSGGFWPPKLIKNGH